VSVQQLSMQLFLQLAFILGAIRVVGLLSVRLGQPQVVGEMIAGVLIGPSLFGQLFPEEQALLFPPEGMSILYAIAQVGLVLYMFLIGCEFDLELIRNRLRSAASVSIAGIVAPFVLGGGAAMFIDGDQGFFGPDVSRLEAMLFLGASMSITAFPMLARIIYERGLAGTSLGTLALAAGAINDAAAWAVLAVVLASFGGDRSIAAWAIGGGLLFAVLMLTVGRRLLQRLEPFATRGEGVSGPLLSFILLLLFLAAWFTDFIGIYAVFGAFILGVAMPRGVLNRDLQRILGPLTTNFLLPLFFIYSGLNTRLGLVTTPTLVGITLGLIVIACLAKGAACYLAARLNGETNDESLAIGALMNARGLMELIILSIGLQRGIITPTLFTMLVMMAIVTTLIASPAFQWVYGKKGDGPVAKIQEQRPN
jgi:Kef-type K+ transport system membrane component KefB